MQNTNHVLPTIPSVSPRPVMPSPQFFDGQALVSWSDPDITVAVPWYIGLMFRTRQPAGTLMQANAGPASTINLMVRYSTWSTNYCQEKGHHHQHIVQTFSYF